VSLDVVVYGYFSDLNENKLLIVFIGKADFIGCAEEAL
jgi:hypothetical protein